MTGLVTAIYDIGCALGAIVAFVYGEKIGRKRSIILANVIVIIAAAIQCASFEYWQMFVSRILGGVGVGLSTVAVPILQSETLPAHNRGCSRLLALLCDALCRQLPAVALPSCVSNPVLAHCAGALSVSMRNASLVGVAWEN
jgi:MFS family permease